MVNEGSMIVMIAVLGSLPIICLQCSPIFAYECLSELHAEVRNCLY